MLKEFQPTHFIDGFYLIKVVNVVLLTYLGTYLLKVAHSQNFFTLVVSNADYNTFQSVCENKFVASEE